MVAISTLWFLHSNSPDTEELTLQDQNPFLHSDKFVMDHITQHFIARMAERCRRTITGEEYQDINVAARRSTTVIRIKHDATHRLIRWKRAVVVVVFCEQRQRALTCWKGSTCHRKLLNAQAEE